MSIFKPFFNNNIGICTNFYTGFNTIVQRIATDNWGNLICGLNLKPYNTIITPTYSGVTYSDQKFIFKLSPEGKVLATNTNPPTQNEGSIVNGLGFNSTKSLFVLSRHRAGYSNNGTSYLTYNNTQNGFSYIRNIGTPSGGADDYICKFLTFQSDDKLLIYGSFTFFYNTITGNRYQNSIVRINQNLQGTDTSFNTYFNSGCTINIVRQQSNGKLIVGGNFTSYSGVTCGPVVRLNLDGSIDNTFNLNYSGSGSVSDIAIQTDGKIILGFATIGGTIDGYTISYICRLNSDGTLDTSYPYNLMNNYIIRFNINDNNQLYVGFSVDYPSTITYSGQTINALFRLNSDGTLDTTFNTGLGFDYSNLYVTPVSAVFDMAYNNGKIFNGGAYIKYNNYIAGNLSGINTDGSFGECNPIIIYPTPTATPTSTPTPTPTVTPTSTPTKFVGNIVKGTNIYDPCAVASQTFTVTGSMVNFCDNTQLYGSWISGSNYVKTSLCSSTYMVISAPSTGTGVGTVIQGCTSCPTTPPSGAMTYTVNYNSYPVTGSVGETNITIYNNTSQSVYLWGHFNSGGASSGSISGSNTLSYTQYNPTISTTLRFNQTVSGSLQDFYSINNTTITANNSASMYVYKNDGILNQSSLGVSYSFTAFSCSTKFNLGDIPVPITPTPTPTPTNTPLFTGSGYFGSTTNDACSGAISGISVNFTGNTTSFCLSTYFTGNTFAYQSSGTYYLQYGGNYQQISITFGSDVAEVIGAGCSACPLTPTPTPTPTGTPTPTPTQTPTPTSPPTYLYYSVDRRATCNTGIENPVAMFAQLPYAFTPTLNGWYRDSSGTCTYSYRISNITPTNPGIFTPVPVDAVTYADSTLACGSGCIPTPTPTPTQTGTPTPTPTTVYELYTADRYTCDTPSGPCTYVETLQIANPTVLVTSKFYLDSINGYIFNIVGGPISGPYLYTSMGGLGTNNCSSLCSI